MTEIKIDTALRDARRSKSYRNYLFWGIALGPAYRLLERLITARLNPLLRPVGYALAGMVSFKYGAWVNYRIVKLKGDSWQH